MSRGTRSAEGERVTVRASRCGSTPTLREVVERCGRRRSAHRPMSAVVSAGLALMNLPTLNLKARPNIARVCWLDSARRNRTLE